MKYLENAKLEALASALSVESSGDCNLESRIESYSCKMVQNDKRQWKLTFQAGTSPRDLQPLSPPVLEETCLALAASPSTSSSVPSSSVFLQSVDLNRVRHRSDASYSGSDNGEAENEGAVYCDSISRKTLFDLTTVLNTSFNDYDFSHSKSDCFSYVPALETVVNSVDQKMVTIVAEYSRLRVALWRTIDEEIKLSECRIYSYNPDYSSDDPFCEDGCVWSFNFFFHNKHKKRILFLACRALRDQETIALSEEQLWPMED